MHCGQWIKAGQTIREGLQEEGLGRLSPLHQTSMAGLLCRVTFQPPPEPYVSTGLRLHSFLCPVLSWHTILESDPKVQ